MQSFNTLVGDEYPNYSNLDQSRIQQDDTTFQFPMSQQSPQQQKSITKHTSSQKKDQSSDLSHIKTPDQQKPRTPRQKAIVSLLPDYLAKKTQSRKQEITIYFFNSDKRMSFQKDQLNKYFQHKTVITIKQLIPYVVKSYCRLILNFQPVQITQQSFQLKLANFQNHDDPVIDPFSHNLDIQFLYDADNLLLIRKPRSMDKIKQWVALFGDKTDLQILQVLMPEKKQFTIQMQKNKTVNALKQKICTFSSQLGKIALISYYNFKLCDNKRKISDLDEKIFEVYRQKIQDYVDRPISKNAGYSFTNVNFYEQLWKNSTKNEQQINVTSQYFVNQTSIYGKLTLSLLRSQIIQKYSGGIMSTFPIYQISGLLFRNSQQRINTLSIHTLIGIKNSNNEQLILRFMYKNRYQTKSYRFEYKQKKQSFLKSLLKIGRIYNKKWSKII